MDHKPLTMAQKLSRWQKIYKKINKEILEKNLSGIDAALYYQNRVKEEKLKMLKASL